MLSPHTIKGPAILLAALPDPNRDRKEAFFIKESQVKTPSNSLEQDVIKKLRSEHRILKTNSVNEITRYKAEVEILKERVEILESTDSSRMLEEQLKLEKTAHSSNILALKTKMENQGKEIEKLILTQKT